MTQRVLNYSYVTKRTDFVSVMTKLINSSKLKEHVKLLFFYFLVDKCPYLKNELMSPSKNIGVVLFSILETLT